MDQQNNQNFVAPPTTPQSPIPPTLSGIPLPQIKQSSPVFKWVAGIWGAIFILGAYLFYTIQYASPEISFAKALGNFYAATSVRYSGQISFETKTDEAFYKNFASLADMQVKTDPGKKFEFVADFDYVKNNSGQSNEEKEIKVTNLGKIDGIYNKAFAGTIDVVVKNGKSYFKFSENAVLEDLGLAAARNTWIEQENQQNQSASTAKNFDVSFSSELDPVTNLIRSMSLLEARTQLKEYATFKDLGSESVNGEKLNRILVILDKQQFVKLTDFVKQEKGVQNIDENKLSAAIEALKQISIETWINKKTNQINKLTLTIDLDKISDGSLKIVLNLNKIQLNQPSQILQPLDALSLQAAVKRQQESDQQNYDGYQLFKQARYAESKPYFEKALQINPNAYRAENNLGEVLRINKQYDEAIKHFTLGLKINPAHENPGINWMQALKDQNKCEALVSQANDFMKGYPSPKFERYIYWYKADGYYCQSKFAEAKENYLKTLDLNPWPDETFKLYLALASSERWANNLDAALSYGKQAVAWAEQNPRAQITAENLANAHMELVVTYFEKRDFASAKTELKTALSIDKNASKGDFYGSYARIINEH